MWTTKEGDRIAIKDMASSHLLATIHYIERNRFQNAAESFAGGEMDAARVAVVNLYLRWPPQYDALVAEAQRRGLIQRGVEGLVKRKR